MKVNFFTEDVDFKVKSPVKIRRWIEAVANQEGFHVAQINYIFCSDTYLHSINLQYLSHDDYTDIITFDNSATPLRLEADIFISIDRVRENSTTLSLPFETELCRVLIHGVLHLCGYQDKTKAAQTEMRKKEDASLSLLISG